MGIKSKIFELIAEVFSQEVTTVLVAGLPIFELRLAIPVGILHFRMPWLQAFLLSLFGNMLVIVPLLLFFKYFFHKLEYVPIAGKFFKWWFVRVERKSQMVRRWGFWGLAFFVSIPLPGTGAWTGAVAATLIEMRMLKASLAISVGVLIAGIIITILSLAVPGMFLVLLKFVQ